LGLARLATNLYCIKSGLHKRGLTTAVATILENAFPDQIEATWHKVFSHMSTSPYGKRRRKVAVYSRVGGIHAKNGEFPQAPKAPNTLEKSQFEKTLQELSQINQRYKKAENS